MQAIGFQILRLTAIGLLLAVGQVAYGQNERARSTWIRELPADRVTAALEEIDADDANRELSVAELRSGFGEDAAIFKYDPGTASIVNISQDADANLTQGQFITISDQQLGLAAITDQQGRRFEPLNALFLTTDVNGAPRAYRMDQHSEGFVWKKDEGHFETQLFLMASDANDPQATDVLAAPILVRITGQDLLDAPYEAVITRLGFEGEKQVEMSSNAASSPVPISLRSPIVPDLLKTVEIGVRKPELRLTANPPSIPAFGIGSTQIIVNSAGELPEGFPITLSTSLGAFAEPELVVDKNGRARGVLWSALVGTAYVSVEDERFRVDPLEVAFVVPVAFLLATLGGAALGAVCQYAWRKHHAPETATAWRSLAYLVFGAGIAIAVIAGFDIPQMIDLPEGRAGLVVPFAAAFLATVTAEAIRAGIDASRSDNV
jgi:hypothetical protein